MNLKCVPLFIFCILYFTGSVFAIKCYQCNSVKDPECEDIRSQPKSAVEHFLKDCEGDFNGKVPFCRKIDLTVLYGKKRRIVRTCGWEQSTHPCYNADNDDHLESVCQCFTHACNHTNNILITKKLILLFGVLSVLNFKVLFGKVFH